MRLSGGMYDRWLCMSLGLTIQRMRMHHHCRARPLLLIKPPARVVCLTSLRRGSDGSQRFARAASELSDYCRKAANQCALSQGE